MGIITKFSITDFIPMNLPSFLFGVAQLLSLNAHSSTNNSHKNIDFCPVYSNLRTSRISASELSSWAAIDHINDALLDLGYVPMGILNRVPMDGELILEVNTDVFAVAKRSFFIWYQSILNKSHLEFGSHTLVRLLQGNTKLPLQKEQTYLGKFNVIAQRTTSLVQLQEVPFFETKEIAIQESQIKAISNFPACNEIRFVQPVSFRETKFSISVRN
jgi:hypothetical protein